MKPDYTEKTSKIDAALTYVTFARDRILPLIYENEEIYAAEEALLEARDALQEWHDTLLDETRTVTGNEKRYIVIRIRKARRLLNGQISECYNLGFDFVEAQEASEELEEALEALGENLTTAEKIAKRIRESDTWDDDLNRQLCDLAGLLEEYNAADGDTFEAVINDAADRLNVEI